MYGLISQKTWDTFPSDDAISREGIMTTEFEILRSLERRIFWAKVSREAAIFALIVTAIAWWLS